MLQVKSGNYLSCSFPLLAFRSVYSPESFNFEPCRQELLLWLHNSGSYKAAEIKMRNSYVIERQ